MIKVWVANINSLNNDDIYQKYYLDLPPFRKKKADEYINKIDKIRSVAAFTLLIKLLNQNKIKYNQDEFKVDSYGKPYLLNSKIYFNISHSGDYVIAAISDKPIGVDVEIKKELKYIELSHLVLNEQEIKKINQIDNPSEFFFKMWTKKESYIKCIGKGLAIPLTSINDVKPYHIKYFKIDHHQFAVCSKYKLYKFNIVSL